MKLSSIIVIIIIAVCLMSYGLTQQCRRMEEQEELLHQKFSKSKTFSDSKTNNGWTDCYLKANGTTIMIAGVKEKSIEYRTMGIAGAGFHILSLDKNATIRPVYSEKWGLMLRIDGKDNLEEKGCLYNTAYITLNAKVMQDYTLGK